MKLTVHTFLTLDGVMQGPGGADEDTTGGFTQGGWSVGYSDEDFGRIVTGWFEKADAFLFGRTTYDLMAGYWPSVNDPDDPVSTALNTKQKYVVTTHPVPTTWGPTAVIAGDLIDAVHELKAKPGGELQVHGSWELANALHNDGLVDEFRLLIFPVVLGAGKKLFAEGSAESGFEVVERDVTSEGLTALVLRPAPIKYGEVHVADAAQAATG
ncbi:MAG TPA: dihydrofolate reductase family protein [Candidatus Lumbricidophila sp.]|nr:dihydrofolate reductase family protein [Candidatus Lumbricidophila sp.]